MGFLQIQQSLWVTNRAIGELVELASLEYGVSDYLVYLVSETTNINRYFEDKLKKHQFKNN